MKKTIIGFIGAFALITIFTACNGGISFSAVDIGVSGSDGTVTITETLDKETQKISKKVTYESAKFTFRTTPGSPGGTITGFKIVSSKVGDNTFVEPKKPQSREAINIFVQSGFTCTPAPAVTQNCGTIEKNPANGSESAALILTGGSELASVMIENRSPADQVYDIIFVGKDDTNHDFELPVKGMRFVGIYNRAD
jgi:hypothetical protein